MAPACKYKIREERLARDEHASLMGLSVSNVETIFVTKSGANVIKLVSLSLEKRPTKLNLYILV